MAYTPYSNISASAASNYHSPKTEGTHWLRDYHHASQLYRGAGSYELAPKVGFLYFVQFNINPEVLTKDWNQETVGYLVKTIELPKFKIGTEAVNQYNRKTQIQTKVSYDPVRIEFHDDNGDNTTGLWKNYYKYHYNDTMYNSSNNNKNITKEFSDTKYGQNDYAYGFRNFSNVPFFTSIDIFVLHRSNNQNAFTKMSLVNPIISAWEHDQLDQSEGTKILKNKMTVAYENVFYETGTIRASDDAKQFYLSDFYDRTLSQALETNDLTANVKQDDDTFNSEKYANIVPPSTGQLDSAVLGLGSFLRAAKQVQELKQNPHQAWSVYGFNIKTQLTNSLKGAIFSAAASVTGR